VYDEVLHTILNRRSTKEASLDTLHITFTISGSAFAVYLTNVTCTIMSSSTHNTPHPIRERGHFLVHYVLRSMHRGAKLILTCPSLENKSGMTAISLQNIRISKHWAIQEDMYRGLAVLFPVLANSIKRAWQLAKLTCLRFEIPVFRPALDNPDYTIYSKRKKALLTCWISVRYLAVLSDILGSLVLTWLEFRFVSTRCFLRV
jgi:hypothetical protein